MFCEGQGRIWPFLGRDREEKNISQTAKKLSKSCCLLTHSKTFLTALMPGPHLQSEKPFGSLILKPLCSQSPANGVNSVLHSEQNPFAS